MLHQFKKSQKTEVKYAYLHDEAYHSSFKKDFSLISIDRESCDYETRQGRKLQRQDTDAIISYQKNDSPTLRQVLISEKTRMRFYDDMLLEVISILEQNTDGVFDNLKDYGWANKFCYTGEESAELLSVTFVDEKANKYKNMILKNFISMKKKLFDPTSGVLKEVPHEKFLQEVINKINLTEKEGKASFYMPVSHRKYTGIIGAKNFDSLNQRYYYTISIALKINYLKQLGAQFKTSSGLVKKENILKI